MFILIIKILHNQLVVLLVITMFARISRLNSAVVFFHKVLKARFNGILSYFNGNNDLQHIYITFKFRGLVLSKIFSNSINLLFSTGVCPTGSDRRRPTPHIISWCFHFLKSLNIPGHLCSQYVPINPAAHSQDPSTGSQLAPF